MPTHTKSSANNVPSPLDVYDVCIIGAGFAGISLAVLLGKRGMNVCVLEHAPRPVYLALPDTKKTAKQDISGYILHTDLRTTAIAKGGQLLLERMGVWESLAKDACPILHIRTKDGDARSSLDFSSEDVGGTTFGWILDNTRLRQELFQAAENLPNVNIVFDVNDLEFHTDTNAANISYGNANNRQHITAKLLVGADGKKSAVRSQANIPVIEYAYHHDALVCVIGHTQPNHHTALELFLAGGPLAVLPMQDSKDPHSPYKYRSAIVWSDDTAVTAARMTVPPEAFCTALGEWIGDTYGDIQVLNNRQAYPLGLCHAHRYHDKRMILIGEAAHAIHPIAGQGLNLTFRDLEYLDKSLGQAFALGMDIGAATVLGNYSKDRKLDNWGMTAATDGLTRLFSNDFAVVRHMRRFGLGLVNVIPPLKRFFMLQAMGLAGKKSMDCRTRYTRSQ